jgi:hypothetical protein
MQDMGSEKRLLAQTRGLLAKSARDNTPQNTRTSLYARLSSGQSFLGEKKSSQAKSEGVCMKQIIVLTPVCTSSAGGRANDLRVLDRL